MIKQQNNYEKDDFESTLAVVAVVASIYGAWKAYDAYEYEENSMLMQNIEALAGPSEAKPYDVCIQLKNCYYKVENSKTRVVDKNGNYLYTTVEYVQNIKKYQVCVYVDETTKYNPCNRKKGVGALSCIHSNGQLNPIPSCELGFFKINEN